MWGRSDTWWALAATASATAAGVMIAASPDPTYLAAAAGLLLLPAMWRLSARRPDLALAVLVLSQALDGYAVATPLVNLSARTILIGVLVIARLPAIRETLRANRRVRYVAYLLLAWWALHAIRVLHAPVDVVLRTMVTQGSFLAVAAIAATLGGRDQTVRYLARAAAAVLIILGAAGVLANLGYLPQPDRQGTAARVMLGIESPFARSYGLNVPFDAVALLVPLCAPYYLNRLLRPGQPLRHRAYAVAVLATLAGVFTFLFQARGLLLQLAVAAGLTIILLSWRTVLVPAAMLVVLVVAPVVAFQQLYDVDEVSSGVRLSTNRLVVDTMLDEPGSLLLGTDEDELFYKGSNLAGWARAISVEEGANAIHNLFLHNLAAGGYPQFLLIVATHVLFGVHAIRLWRQDRASTTSQVLLVASVLVLLVLNIEPVRANILGSWIVLGLVVAWPVKHPGSDAPRTGRPPRTSQPTPRTPAPATSRLTAAR